ncbi:MAG: flavin reductase family protein [Chloroflexi bacterium]|nr:flavin reductase family protein [Chloroflexota bacterium]
MTTQHEPDSAEAVEKAISGALKMIPYGFHALTSKHGKEMNVMVLNWFSQVSFEPQHIVIGLQQTSTTYGLVEASGHFVVNIFHQAEADVVKQFSKSREKNPQKFEGAHWQPAPVTGVPVLDEAAAFLECEVAGELDTGAGHSVILGRVVGGGVRASHDPGEGLTLPHVGWSYSG